MIIFITVKFEIYDVCADDSLMHMQDDVVPEVKKAAEEALLDHDYNFSEVTTQLGLS